VFVIASEAACAREAGYGDLPFIYFNHINADCHASTADLNNGNEKYGTTDCHTISFLIHIEDISFVKHSQIHFVTMT